MPILMLVIFTNFSLSFIVHLYQLIGIFFSKDRREEVIEVEEDTELVTPPGSSQPLKLMTQGQWMKGCPEGGEQGFLFSLYSQLSEGNCACPHDCGGSIPRDKSDFFIIYVRTDIALLDVVNLSIAWLYNLHRAFKENSASEMQDMLKRILLRMCRANRLRQVAALSA